MANVHFVSIEQVDVNVLSDALFSLDLDNIDAPLVLDNPVLDTYLDEVNSLNPCLSSPSGVQNTWLNLLKIYLQDDKIIGCVGANEYMGAPLEVLQSLLQRFLRLQHELLISNH